MSKNVNIKFSSDTTNAKKGITGLEKEIKRLGNNSVIRGLNVLNGATSLLGKTLQAGIKGVQKTVAVIKDLHAASLKQVTAEKQLESASKNNPFLNKENVQSLKDYASELQKVGTIGDEELLPMMSRLAAAGRSQKEIQDIMSAALDMSASGAMSMDSAVETLNKTFSGTAGLLGRTLPEIKNMTQAQLQHGDAVKIVAEKYKGMAKEVADATGYPKKLSNAFGDLKEQLGMGFTALFAPASKFFTWVIEGFTNITKKFNDFLGIEKPTQNIKKSDVIKEQIEKLEEENKEYEKRIQNAKDIGDKYQQSFLEGGRKDRYVAIGKLKAELKEIEKQEKEVADQAALEADASHQAIEKSNKALEQELQKIKAKYDAEEKLTGKRDKAAETQEKYNAEYSSYLDLQTNDIAQGEECNTVLQARWNSIVSLKKEVERLTKSEEKEIETVQTNLDTEKEYQKILAEWQGEKGNERLSQLKSELEILQAQVDEFNSIASEQGLSTEKTEEFKTELESCKEVISQIQDEIKNIEFQEMIDKVKSVMDTIESGMQKITDTMQQATDLALQVVDKDAEKENKKAQDQYEAGIISYDEYQSKKDEIDKEAAKKEYKIKMAQWAMNLAMAQASTAQAVVAALADTSGVPQAVKVLNSVTAGLLGAAQIAAVVAAKPPAPSFSTGGFLTGNSTKGDKIPFNGNAGESVLNPAEMRHFMYLANGGSGSAPVVNMPIKIINNASNEVTASAQTDDRQITISVNKIVNKSMTDGVYSSSMKKAQGDFNGAKYY